jgi:hypothetical protein
MVLVTIVVFDTIVVFICFADGVALDVAYRILLEF